MSLAAFNSVSDNKPLLKGLTFLLYLKFSSTVAPVR